MITFGVGEPWKIARAIVDGLPVSSDAAPFQDGVPLARLTTIGTGGPARALRRAPNAGRGRGRAACRTRAAASRSRPSGLGSNVLAADAGVDMLVLRLAGELADARVPRTTSSSPGGGATNAVCLHRGAGSGARRLRVRLRDPRDGRWWGADERRSLRQRLERDRGARARRDRGRIAVGSPPPSSGSRTASRTCEHGQVVAAVEYRLGPRDPAEIRAEVRELIERRKATQPTTKRTFGSVFKNPPGELGAGQMLERCGLKGYRHGGACISPMHANFIENAGDATTADCLALMAEARRRARETFGVELEHEVVLLGSRSTVRERHGVRPEPSVASLRIRGRSRRPRRRRAGWRAGDESKADRVPARARPRPSSAPAAGHRASASDLQRLIPSARSLATAVLIVVGAGSPGSARARRSVFSVRTSTSPEHLRVSPHRCGAPWRRCEARASSKSTSTRPCARWRRCRPLRAPGSTGPIRTRFASSSSPSEPVAVVRQGADAYLVAAEREGDGQRRAPRTGRRWRGSGSSEASSCTPGSRAEGDLQTPCAAVAPLAAAGFPGRVSSVTATRESLTLRLRSGLEIRLGDPLDVARSSRLRPG